MVSVQNLPQHELNDIPSSGATFTLTGIAYDYAIGGLPFISAASPQTPYVEETAEYRKQQTDQALDVGENSLVFWWLKSQSSYHAGAGQRFLDSAVANDPAQPIRFESSLGVNPWTIGQLSLHSSMTLNKSTAATGTLLMSGYDGTTPVYFQAEGVNLYRVVEGSSTPVTWGGTTPILSLATDGANYYAATSTAIYKGTMAGGAGTSVYTYATSTNVVLGYVKARLMVAIGGLGVYELSAPGPALPTPKYNNSTINYTCWTESPQAMYLSGNIGGKSLIVRFVLDTAGNVPTLSGGIITAQLPHGEFIYSIYCYLGQYLAIGTNKGVRMATINLQGDILYGPQLFPVSFPVRDFIGQDRYIYCACTGGLNGLSGLFRIDLGTLVSFQRYAYATDLQTHVAGEVTGVGILGTRLLVMVDGQGSFLQDATSLEPTGYLVTSRIRYGTTEPKLGKVIKLRLAQALQGTLSASIINADGSQALLTSFSVPGTIKPSDTVLNVSPQEFLQIRFDLSRGTDPTTGPVMTAWQLKSLPAAKRQRQFQVPLSIYDIEMDRTGQEIGRLGSAITRLKALEALEETGDAVLFQHFAPGTQTDVRLCVIDKIQFMQTASPGTMNGWGGVAMVTLRSLT